MVAAQETTLQSLLEGAKQYHVPLYQRTYSWTEIQLKRIWDDVCQLARDRADHPAATHFIGSLVLAPSPSMGPVGVAEYLVVDGQQRLTTLTILLCAIRDHRAEHESPKHRLRLDQQYLTNPFEEQRWLKLVPTQADRDAYVACVKSTPQAGGENPVGRAYRFFAKALTAIGDAKAIAALGDGEGPVGIEQIESAVITGLALVAITAKAGDNVYRIFESLNNTGLTLTQADLLRNYIFMRLPTRGQTVYESLWLPLQQRFTPTELVLLFWLDLVHRDPKVKQTDTYVEQQKRLEPRRSVHRAAHRGPGAGGRHGHRRRARRVDHDGRHPVLRERQRDLLLPHGPAEGSRVRQHLAAGALPQREVRGRLPAPQHPYAFDEVTLREELRQRLNQLPGVEIAAAKLALRPGFSLAVLADADAREALLDHLRWFYDQAQVSVPDEAALV